MKSQTEIITQEKAFSLLRRAESLRSCASRHEDRVYDQIMPRVNEYAKIVGDRYAGDYNRYDFNSFEYDVSRHNEIRVDYCDAYDDYRHGSIVVPAKWLFAENLDELRAEVEAKNKEQARQKAAQLEATERALLAQLQEKYNG